MATMAALKTVPARGDESDREFVKEVRKRISSADTDRNRHKKKIGDCNKFGLPWRHKFDATQPSPDDQSEVYEDMVQTVVEDFSADMLNTFTPMKNAWLAALPTETMDVGDARQIEGPLEKYTSVIFSEMRRSNLYQALQESYLDLSVGTMGMLIQDRHPSEPIHCQAIPSTDLLLNRGPWGDVDGRFRRWKVAAGDILVLWPDAKKPNPEAWKPDDRSEIEVLDGVYRDWSDRGNEVWEYCVLVGDHVAIRARYTGSGSCPFVIARWSRDSTTAWGVGPLYRTILTVKALNHIRYEGLANLSKVTNPVTSYEDDGVVNVDHGIEPGTWIPRAQGSKAPEVIESKGRFDVESMNIEDMRSAIRRAHYQDEPQQQGKTPPSATQWADEAARKARRMGTPATNLVIEWQYPIFKRFAYLLHKRGKLPKVTLNGKDIALEPVSPLLRAQEQEDVMRADRFIEMIGGRFGPEALNTIVKQTEYASWLADKMGVPSNLVRTPQEMAQAMQQMAPLLGAAGGGGEPPGGGGGAPPA